MDTSDIWNPIHWWQSLLLRLMYLNFYNWAMHLFGASLGLVGKFNDKLKAGYEGRKNLFPRLEKALDGETKIIWFHAASLGEAEQAVPILEAVRKEYNQHKILLTFFSPSGMDHFKRKDLADFVFYLPLDTKSNARKFLDIVKPGLAFFVKYEIWPNFFREVKHRGIPLIIAPAVFLPDFFYFKNPHKKHFIPLLKGADQILVQDENSQKLLAEHGVKSNICGDSRFDRVLQNAATPFEDKILHDFTQNATTLIGGSTWQKGEEILAEVLKANPDLKMIIAPHNIKEENIKRVSDLFKPYGAFRYSQAGHQTTESRVCIIDNIGLLSRLYRYGDMAYIGGAFGKGIHNSLEAAAYGLPLFFGPNHQTFIEPQLMLKEGFATEIKGANDLQKVLNPMLKDKTHLKILQQQARTFVEQNSGSVDKVMLSFNTLLPK
ncbi:3-deoxy-D-manno-octulosonic-acid transferase [Owenweeksia hongkongensis DSM 17368]|uniref:3-deoxy-D-manno-octulosonic acid transferase n=1 Tax=Owenweeksia hongkongensis (strain DSM 17368 / CIP 108786 / JCM 12287 / NRRL B-23963 / UST20020801) TaxID=926562 RepID=G8R021_OWEHD|nr:glycosyltransferase N-terminal domain-containing protein [Owenweeksia hongkongensis]AEV32661.1 3-deoxy-D-manno-octulosonic-acid transferase [Owenweeksia hongkongensis DSM 17368]